MKAERHGISAAPAALISSAPLAPACSGPEVVALVLCAVGAALLPDLDHHKSTITRSFMPFTWLLYKLLHAICPNHRGGVHSLWGATLTAAGVHYAVHHIPYAGPAIATFLIGLALDLLTPGTNIPAAAARFAGTAAIVAALTLDHVTIGTGADTLVIPLYAIGWTWLPQVVWIGYVAHLAGDQLTEGGIRWLWLPRWLLAIFRAALTAAGLPRTGRLLTRCRNLWRWPKWLAIKTGGTAERVIGFGFGLATTAIVLHQVGALAVFDAVLEYAWGGQPDTTASTNDVPSMARVIHRRLLP